MARVNVWHQVCKSRRAMHRFKFAFAAVVLFALGNVEVAGAAPTRGGQEVRRQVQKPKPKPKAKRMFLKRVRGQRLRDTPFGNTIRFLRGKGLPVPEITIAALFSNFSRTLHVEALLSEIPQGS